MITPMSAAMRLRNLFTSLERLQATRLTLMKHRQILFCVRQISVLVPSNSLSPCFHRISHKPFLVEQLPKNSSRRNVSYGIFAPNEQTSDELLSYGNELLEEFASADVTDEDVETIKNSLSGILYQLYIRDKRVLLIDFFDRIIEREAASEASYNIIMRHFAQNKDLENVKRVFGMLRENEQVPLHSRSYIPLIVVSLRLENYEHCSFYLKQMTECLGPKFKENNFHDILNTCNELVTVNNYPSINQFVLEVFEIFEEYGSNELSKRLVESIGRWFERDPVNNWHLQMTSMGKRNGMCQYCKKRLEKVSIPPERLLKLKRNLLTLVKTSIIKNENSKFTDLKSKRTNLKIRNEVSSKSKYLEFYDTLTAQPVAARSNNSKKNLEISQDVTASETLQDGVFDKLSKFRRYLDSNGPFDIVIDVLNIGYFTHGFNPVQVRNIIDVFIEQRKKILVLCAAGLKEEFLTANEVQPANRRLQQLVLYMNCHCSLFFVGSSFVDDFYILYSLIHHNFEIELVSRDLFRDHLFHLDADNTADFQRWQQKSQYILKAIRPDGSPVFRSRMDFHIAMQHDKDGWHVPIGNRSWLCVSKNSQ